MNEFEKYIVKRLDSMDEKITKLLIARGQGILIVGLISLIISMSANVVMR